ncbi:MAG: hypothetical protein HYT87_07845 [Nitrospirae bacterium]|nr:hypothetical protein [Nitrospirota bacterium]
MAHKSYSPALPILVLLGLVLGSCKGKQPPAPVMAPSQAARPPELREETPNAVKRRYRYVPENKRDPFRTYVEAAEVVGARDCGLKYPRENFKLVGIMWGDVAIAAFEDEAGEGCFLRVGDRLGKEKTVIREILFDHVVVVEKPLGIGPEISHEMWLNEAAK